MAVYEGSNGTVKVDVAATGTPAAVASVRSWSLDISRETVESTAMGVGSRTYLKGLESFSGSMDVVYDDAEAALVSSALNPTTDDVVAVELYPDGDVAATKFAGNIIVTGYSVSASYDGLVEASVSFTGTGDLTTETI